MFRLLPISIFAVVLLCLGSAVQAQMISPEHVEGAETINAAQAKALFDQGAVFIDLRPQEDFAKGHIAAAININIAGAFNRNMIEKKIPKAKPSFFIVMVYIVCVLILHVFGLLVGDIRRLNIFAMGFRHGLLLIIQLEVEYNCS